MRKLIRRAREAGIKFSVMEDEVKVTYSREAVSTEILEHILLFREPLRDHLLFLRNLKRRSRIETADGIFEVWETYFSINRVGVFVPKIGAPIFYDLDQISKPTSNV